MQLEAGYTYTYNGAGDLTNQTDPKGQITTQAFDDLGRLTTRNEAGHLTTWSYDCTNAKGKACSVTNSGTSYGYDQNRGYTVATGDRSYSGISSTASSSAAGAPAATAPVADSGGGRSGGDSGGRGGEGGARAQ